MSKTGILRIVAWDASINTTLMVLCALYVPCKCCRVSFSTAGNQTCHIAAFYLFVFFFSFSLQLYIIKHAKEEIC